MCSRWLRCGFLKKINKYQRNVSHNFRWITLVIYRVGGGGGAICSSFSKSLGLHPRYVHLRECVLTCKLLGTTISYKSKGGFTSYSVSRWSGMISWEIFTISSSLIGKQHFLKEWQRCTVWVPFCRPRPGQSATDCSSVHFLVLRCRLILRIMSGQVSEWVSYANEPEAGVQLWMNCSFVTDTEDYCLWLRCNVFNLLSICWTRPGRAGLRRCGFAQPELWQQRKDGLSSTSD